MGVHRSVKTGYLRGVHCYVTSDDGEETCFGQWPGGSSLDSYHALGHCPMSLDLRQRLHYCIACLGDEGSIDLDVDPTDRLPFQYQR